MRVKLRTGGLFWEQDLRDFLASERQALFAEIDSLDEDRFDTSSLDDQCDQLINQHSLSVPRIYTPQEPVKIEDVEIDLRTRGYLNAHDYERPALRKGTRFTVIVPFTGNPQLLKCQPHTAMNGAPPDAAITADRLAFAYDLLPDEADSFTGKFNRDLASLKKYLGQIACDLDAFKSSLREPVRQRIRARQQKLLHDRQVAESLGIQSRRAADIAPQEAPVPPKADAPQPPPGFPEITHSLNYKVLMVGDKEIPLQPMAVRAIHFIYLESERTGNPNVDEQKVLNKLPTQQDSVYKATRHTGIWNELIRRGDDAGTVELIWSNLRKMLKTP